MDATLAHLYEVNYPKKVSAAENELLTVSDTAQGFVKEVTAVMMAGHGDDLPVSKMTIDGTYPSGTKK